MTGINGPEISAWQWGFFAVVIIVLLAIDLITLRGHRSESHRASLIWSVVWIGTGLGFAVYVWVAMSGDAAQQYLAAYLIEKSLSLDNLFMFMLIFQSLRIPKRYQHKVLFWGIIGALVFRGVFIIAGARALEQFEWVSFVFGGLLIYAAYRAVRGDLGAEQESKIIGFLSRHLPVARMSDKGRFIERHGDRLVATPLLVALLAVEATDVMFAIDSVPAALSMTRDLFLVYSSNIFAILGLRALYLLLAGAIADAEYLKYGLGTVLAFAGVKIVVDRWLDIPPYVSVGFIVLVIGISVWASLHSRRKARRRLRAQTPPLPEPEDVT